MKGPMVLLWLVVALCEVPSPALGDPLDGIWQAFKQTYNKEYGPNEDVVRRLVWQQHVEKIQTHNLRYDLGLVTFSMGINEYADLTFEEYRKYLMGSFPPYGELADHNTTKVFRIPYGFKVADAVDWRTQGYVTSVKNQGSCGSCWAFSSAGALEGLNFKATGTLVDLSPQNLVDCVTGNLGCSGGWMNKAFKYVRDNDGIDSENGYPYQEKETGSCKYDAGARAATCAGLENVAKDESSLMAAVASAGPISIAVDTAHDSFQMYKSGVYVEPACTATVTHAMLIVGYGSDGGQDYWIVKNSWGESWGEAGYIKFARNNNNMCGIADHASYPTA